MSLIPYCTNEDIDRYISMYDEQAFQDMPYWLRETVRHRELTYTSREPTELEQWETVSDAREHRILNNEKTMQDFKDKYKHGKSFNNFL
jgi:hypothetical protein